MINIFNIYIGKILKKCRLILHQKDVFERNWGWIFEKKIIIINNYYFIQVIGSVDSLSKKLE